MEYIYNMKIQLLSDTHSRLHRFKPSKQADLIVHAGDFTSGVGDSIEHIVNFVDICDEADKDYVIVLGNHDYYGFVYREDLLKRLDELQINYLVSGKEYVKDDITFIGDTLFTNFSLYNNPLSKIYAQLNIADFQYIKLSNSFPIYADWMVDEFNKQLNFINQYKNKNNVIVITHFVPNPILLQDKFKGSELNPYFINNIELTGFKTWICGHTHQTTRTEVDGCSLYVNAMGYESNGFFECPEFEPEFIINV